jgi:hypothetical protein
VSNVFVDSGHDSGAELQIMQISEFRTIGAQLLCYNGEWYTTGDVTNAGSWTYSGNIFAMADFVPIATVQIGLRGVRKLFE